MCSLPSWQLNGHSRTASLFLNLRCIGWRERIEVRVPHVEWLSNGRQQSNNIWDNKVVMIFRKKLFIILGNRQCSIHTHSELTLVAWKYGSAYQVYCLFSTIQHTKHNSAQLQFALILYHLSSFLIFSSLVYPFFWLCSRFTRGSAESFGQHRLYSLQLFYPSVSSDVEPTIIFQSCRIV